MALLSSFKISKRVLSFIPTLVLVAPDKSSEKNTFSTDSRATGSSVRLKQTSWIKLLPLAEENVTLSISSSRNDATTSV